MRLKKGVLGVLGFVMIFFSSCIGVTTNITIREGGSGTLDLEYRISRTMDSLGKLDGNERWLTLPVGKADFERTISRIDGLKLTSFSVREDEKDRVVKVKVAFSTPDALAGFLDASGQRARLTREAEKYRLALTMGGGAPDQKPELLEFTETVFQGYTMELGIAFPREAVLTLTDGGGTRIDTPPGGNIQWNGRNLRFSSPMAALVTAKEPVLMEIRW
jgi:hypothetical protein